MTKMPELPQNPQTEHIDYSTETHQSQTLRIAMGPLFKSDDYLLHREVRAFPFSHEEEGMMVLGPFSQRLKDPASSQNTLTEWCAGAKVELMD